MKSIFAFLFAGLLLVGCGGAKQAEKKTKDPEPVEVRALHSAQDMQRDINRRQDANNGTAQEGTGQQEYHRPDGGFGTLDESRDVKKETEQQEQENKQAAQDTNQ